MPNNFFRFKQFTIYQDQCAMKVNTDSCIFGGVADHDNPACILDIGTGSGLLALMMAQRFRNSMIDAIEPDNRSADQAESNFRNSPWAERIMLYNMNIEHFTDISENRYDLIIANPPWFDGSLKPTGQRNKSAKHLGTLTWEKLSIAVNKLLVTNGTFYILLPVPESGIFRIAIESKGFILNRQVMIKNQPDARANRIISGFSRSDSSLNCVTLAINNSKGSYSEEFKTLLREFYLAF